MTQFTRLPAPTSLDDLNTKQKAFVERFMELGGAKGCEVDAALDAGYGGGVRDKAARQARDMMKNPRILAAIRLAVADKFTSASVIAANTLIELAESGPANVRLQAARDIIDRGVGPVMSRSAHLHAKVETIEDYLDELDRTENGDRDAIDADFEPVSHQTDADSE